MWLATSLLIVIPALLAIPHTTQGQGTIVRLEVPSKEPEAGAEPFDVTVLVDSVTNLGAFEFELTYDGGVVKVEDVQEGPFLGSSGRRVQCLPPDIADSSVLLRCVTLGATPDGPTGSGVLAVVTFRPTSAGTSPLHFARVILTDPPANTLPAEAEDAALTVTQPRGGGFSWTLWGSVAGGVVVVLVLAGAAVWWFRRQASST